MSKMINKLQKNKLLMGLVIAAVCVSIYLVYKNNFESESFAGRAAWTDLLMMRVSPYTYIV